MEPIRAGLYNAHQGYQVLLEVWRLIKPVLIAGHRLRLEVKAERRTLPQNSLIHPVVKEIAEAAGRPTDVDSLRKFRRMMLEQWWHETGRKPEFERSLDGERWVCVDKGTSDLDKLECSEFIDWMYAFGAQHGVEFKEAA